MNQDLPDVSGENALALIRQSKFEIHSGTYIYARVSALPEGKHFFVSQDNEEITVVTLQEQIAQIQLIERNKDDYGLIGLLVSVPFYSVGFLAVVSGAFARNDMNILIVSTYSKDYILVRKDLQDKAEQILLGLGFQKKELSASP